MKLQTKFIAFIVVIHAVTIGLSFYIFRANKLLFIGSEIFILISLMICWTLYNDMIQPLQLLMRGIDAIHDRDFNVKFLKTGKFEMDKLIEVYNAMIDELRGERTRQEEQHFFLEKLIQTSPTGILILDFDGQVADMNPKALSFLGFTKREIIGKVMSDFDNPVFKTIVALPTGTSKTVILNGGKTYKVQKAHFIDRGFARSFVMIEELTAEILAAEKQAYGKVIRMMSHEVNNSIGAVNSILDTTLGYFTVDEGNPDTFGKAGDMHNALQVAIERNNHLNQFMRQFADVIRLPEPRFETVDVGVLVQKVVQLMSFKAKERGVVINIDGVTRSHPVNLLPLPEDSGYKYTIKADLGQIEQILINIIKNAIEAADKPDAYIEITLSQNPKQLCIVDNGRGISHSIEDKLFTPFFTTKNGGQGVGLTLARDILTNHHFDFDLKTEASGLTCFAIRFS
jgi:nitrogen fixation/metabolism regulation signal transduction histidine kinase